MLHLLSILIIAIAADMPIDGVAMSSDGVAKPGDVIDRKAREVFYCDFNKSWDKNFDAWPDGWTRQRGAAFPHYVKMLISDEPSPVGNRCLRIDLDSGAAIAYSPAVEISPRFGYVLEGQLKTESLKHDRAFISLTFLDGKQRRLKTYYSQVYQSSNGWEKIRLGPIDVNNQLARYAVVGFHLQPLGGVYADFAPSDATADGAEVLAGSLPAMDLVGAAMFDDIRLSHLPRVVLSTNSPQGIIDVNYPVKVKCRVSGFSHAAPAVEFVLVDHAGREIARRQCQSDPGDETRRIESLLDDFSTEPDGREASASWEPPLTGPGFYRVRAELAGAEPLREEISFVVADLRSGTPNTQFGWSLPRGDEPVPLAELPHLMSSLGVGHVKYPLWYGKDCPADRIEALSLFAERVDSMGIALVGVLDNPPPEVAAALGDNRNPRAVDIFTAAANSWLPSLQVVLTQLADRVEWWQLGGDRDASFAECVDLQASFAKVKAELDRVDYDVSLGIPWNCSSRLPRSDRAAPAWRVVALADDPPSTPEQLGAYLRGFNHSQAAGGRADADFEETKLAVSLQPLERGRYDATARINDLLQRMMAAAIDGADCVTIIDPFDPHDGLFEENGMPGELLLPWRTAVKMLEGRRYLGEMQLPNHSQTRIFYRGDEAVLVVWNERPCAETVYLGDDVYQIDVWGRKTQVSLAGDEQVLQVGPTPSFVVGLNKNVCLWRTALDLEITRIPCLPGLKIDNRLHFKNTFPQAVSGKITITADRSWNIKPAETIFKLAGAEKSGHDFTLMLPFDVNAGRYDVRLDCTVNAEKVWHFNVYRTIEIGLGDVYMEHSLEIDAGGNLCVKQRFVNNSPQPVSFRCSLSAPGRRMMTTYLENLPPGEKINTYILPNGKELIGKTLRLRGEEIGGRRRLNYEFVAQERG